MSLEKLPNLVAICVSKIYKFIFSRDVEEGYITEIDDVTPFVQKAIKAGIKILFFNGDVDSVCNVVHNLQVSPLQ